MKIIHINYSDIVGGAARAAYRIHNSLLKNNVNSLMWVNKKNSNNWTVETPSNKIVRVQNKILSKLISMLLNKMLKVENKNLHSISILPSKLLKDINNSDADVVHLHWIQNEMLSVKDIAKIKKPIVWTLHDMWAFCGTEHYTDDFRWREGYNSYNKRNYMSGFDLNRITWLRKKKHWKNPLQIVTPSIWLSKCVSESKLMHDWPVSTIPYPIDTEKWKPIDRENARKQFKFSQDVSLILFGAVGGGKDPRKGFDLLLEALNKLEKNSRTKKFELVVFGQNKNRFEIDIGFSIHYLGNQQDDLNLQALYSAADVMVVPSRQDNLPNTAIEAQVCGTPVVSFDIGGLADIIDHQTTGYLAKAYDTNDLANGINWVLNHQEIEKLKRNSQKRSKEKFSENKISEAYLDIYKKLLF